MALDLDRLETAVMMAEHAAREALLVNGVVPTGLVLTVAFDDDSGNSFCVGSKVPDPPPAMLASSLHESACDAGWSPLDEIGGQHG